MEKRSLIGLLTNDLVGSYQYALWAGMKSAARAEDCDLVSFNGGEIGSPDRYKAMRNAAFELVQHAKVDALVLMAPVLGNSATAEQIEFFVRTLPDVPVVTVGVAYPGHPSVQVDNAAGMTSLLEHVVRVHGRKRLAFVGGPVRNPDAIVRRRAFLDILEREGLPFDPDLDVVGEFDFGIARDRVRALLDTGVEFDVLVAANDEMALGAIEALKERGRRIPDDVIVTGFDDIEDGLFATPALTTIHQPVFEQGEACVRLALDRIDGIEVPDLTLQPATLVRRGSCGCLSKSQEETRTARCAVDPGRKGMPGGVEHLESVRMACDGGSRVSGPLRQLVEALSRDALNGGSEGSMSTFLFLMDTASRPDDEHDRWQIFLSRLRSASLAFFAEDPASTAALEELLHQMRVVVHERVFQGAAYRSVQLQRWARSLQETGCELINSFELSDLVETLARDLKTLQISSLHLLLDSPDACRGEMRLALSVHHGIRANLPAGGKMFGLERLFRRIRRRSHIRSELVVEPLFFKDVHLGFVILEIVNRRGMLLDAFRGQISASLMGSRVALANRRQEPVRAAANSVRRREGTLA
jgi:phosphoserine phosphatase RsbU/P